MNDPITISFEVVPGGLTAHADIYAAIRAALAVVRQSGLPYRIGSMETTLEGEYDQVMAVIKAAQDTVLAAGANRVFTIIKVDYAPTTERLCKLSYDEPAA